MHAATWKNLILSLVLSFGLTLIGVVYIVYPFLTAIFNAAFSDSQTGGIGAVAGGVNGSFLTLLVLIAPALFLVIFLLLQNKSAKS